MNPLEKMADLAKSMLTTDTHLKHLQRELDETKAQVRGLTESLQNVRERLSRLEAQREADLAQMRAEVSQMRAERMQFSAQAAQFQAAVERAEFRLPQLPPSES